MAKGSNTGWLAGWLSAERAMLLLYVFVRLGFPCSPLFLSSLGQNGGEEDREKAE